MHPLVRAGAFAALLIALGSLARRPPRKIQVRDSVSLVPSAPAPRAAEPLAPCPRGTLPDHAVCVPVPAPSACLNPRACSQSHTP